MTCNNCKPFGTVWFDHKAKKWVHGIGNCSRPEPRIVKP